MLALRIAKLMAYDLGVGFLLVDELTERLAEALPLSFGVDDARAAVLESCRYLFPVALAYGSDASGRVAVLCRD
eukprot:15461744-Alexandrium_andersonii.AAC.1